MMHEDAKKLLQYLGIDNDDTFKMAVMEVLGELVLCIHWLRGTFNWLMHTGAITWNSDTEQENYERLFESIEQYEKFIWEIVPSRSFLVALQVFRRTGKFPDDIDILTAKDAHGRIPYGTSPESLEDIRDLLRRLGDARIAHEQGRSELTKDDLSILWTQEKLQKRVDEIGPWHYCHQFPFGVVTGTSQPDGIPDKMDRLLVHGAFSRPIYPKVLDIGANSGIIAMWFVDKKESHVTAIERGPKYYPQLELAIELKRYTQSIKPIFSDATEADFGNAEYDLIIFLGTLHHIAEDKRQEVLNKCLHAMLPGGEIVVQTKSEFPVLGMLKIAGFVGERLLYESKPHERSAWTAIRDPMKLPAI